MKYKIKELLEKVIDNRGKTPNIVENGIPLIEINAIAKTSKYPNYNVIRKNISDETYKNFRSGNPQYNDILIGTVGTLGSIAMMDKRKASIAQNLIALRTKKEFNPNWLYYALKYKMIDLLNLDIGGVQPSIKVPHLMNFELEVPSKNIQDKIALVLSKIEEKILINNQINNSLLKLCRYKYDELNNNYNAWDLVKINDLNLEVTDYVANGSFKSLADNVILYDEKEYALYVRNTDLKVNFTDKRKYVDKKSYDFLRKSKLNGGELIISNVGDVGSVYICPYLDIPMTLGSNVIMLYSTDAHYYNYFLYFFFTSVYGQYMINGITGGSAQPKFNKTDFRNMKIKIPTLEQLEHFNNEIDPIYKKYELNIKENQKLSELRDTLLPKLMNGEIDLEKIEI